MQPPSGLQGNGAGGLRVARWYQEARNRWADIFDPLGSSRGEISPKGDFAHGTPEPERRFQAAENDGTWPELLPFQDQFMGRLPLRRWI